MATKMVLPGMDMMKGVGIGPLNIGNVLDTMGFVKKAWGAMNAPSSFMPTMDVEELNKRIVDLQAVEQWLMMNLSMIQGSIQALEVQRATIETLKSVTKGFAPGNLAAAFPGMNLPQEMQNASPPPQLPPGYYFSPPPAPAPVAAPSPLPVFAAPRDMPAAPPVASRVKTPSAKATKAAAPADKDPGLNALAWLEFLQGQFNQVTQAAMSGSSLKSAAKSVAGTMAKSAVKAGAKVATKAAKNAGAKVSKKAVPKPAGQTTGKPRSKAPAAPGRTAARSGAAGKSRSKP